MVLPYWQLEQPACQWFCHTGSWSSHLLDSGRFRRSKASHLLDCGLWALCQTVSLPMVLPYWQLEQPASGFWTLQTLQSSGAPNPFFLVARNCPSNASNPSNASLETCQWFCHTGRWSSQLLHSGRFRRSKTSHLLACGLWALCQTVGGVVQTVGSGLWWRRNCLSNASN